MKVKREVLNIARKHECFLGEWKKEEHIASSCPQHSKLPKMGEYGAGKNQRITLFLIAIALHLYFQAPTCRNKYAHSYSVPVNSCLCPR